MTQKYLEYAKTFDARKEVVEWLEKNLENYLKKNEESQDEIEHIIDYLSSDDAPVRLARMSYAEAKKNSEKWTKTQQKKGNNIQETAKDTEIVLDFKDGFKIVKLIGEAAYKREGFLMSHCVGGYFGNGKEIYSLRDKNNMPHCTMEKDQQIKGKGNGDISPKYVDYIVKFLEWTGMKVRDSEMAHLGYETVKFGKYATTKLYRDKYAVKGTKIDYKSDYIILYSQSELKNYKGEKLILLDCNLEIKK